MASLMNSVCDLINYVESKFPNISGIQSNEVKCSTSCLSNESNQLLPAIKKPVQAIDTDNISRDCSNDLIKSTSQQPKVKNKYIRSSNRPHSSLSVSKPKFLVLSLQNWKSLLRGYCKPTTKRHSVLSIIPTAIIELCVMYHGNDSLRWKISRSDLDALINYNQATLINNIDAPLFKCHTSLTMKYEYYYYKYVVFSIEIKPRIEHINFTTIWNLNVEADVDTDFTENIRSIANGIAGCSKNLHKQKGVLVGQSYREQINIPVRFWAKEMMQYESINFYMKFKVTEHMPLPAMIPNAKYEWVLEKHILQKMKRHNSPCVEEEMWRIPEGFGFRNMFHMKIVCTQGYFKIYLWLAKVPFICDNTYTVRMRIGSVNVRLIPNDSYARSKVWRQYRTHLRLGEVRSKKWRFPRERMIQYLCNHSIVVELKDMIVTEEND